MSVSYTCVSCRLRLLSRTTRLGGSSWSQKAPFVTFNNGSLSNEAGTSKDSAAERRPRKTADARKASQRTTRVAGQPKRTSLEDQFIQRLREQRDGDVNSPYSDPSSVRYDTIQIFPEDGRTVKGHAARSVAAMSRIASRSSGTEHQGQTKLNRGYYKAKVPLNLDLPDKELSANTIKAIQLQLKFLQEQVSRLQRRPAEPAKNEKAGRTTAEAQTPNHSRNVNVSSTIPAIGNTSEEATITGASNQQPLDEQVSAPKLDDHSGTSPVTLQSSIPGPHFRRLNLRKDATTESLAPTPRAASQEEQNAKLTSRIDISPVQTTASSQGTTDMYDGGNKATKGAEERFRTLRELINDMQKPFPELWARAIELCNDESPGGARTYRNLWKSALADHQGIIPANDRRIFVAQARSTFQALMIRLTKAWCTEDISDLVKSPATMLRNMHPLLVDRSVVGHRCLWILLDAAVNRIQEPGPKPSSVTISAILTEIHDTLELLAKFYGRTKTGKQITWKSFLPLKRNISGFRKWTSSDFSSRLRICFPLLPSQRSDDFAAIAATAFVVLYQSRTPVESSGTQDALPQRDLLVFLGRLIPGSNVDQVFSAAESSDFKLFQDYVSDAAQRYILETLQGATAAAMQVRAKIDPESVAAASKASVLTDDKRTPYGEMLIKRLARAMEDKNVYQAENLWEEAVISFGLHDTEYGAKNVPVNVFNHFLMTFAGLGRMSRAVDIWNIMSEGAVPASVATWGAMIQGNVLARNPEGVVSIWEKMVQAGVKPDGQLWAMRIRGLCGSGRWKQAMDAFAEMSKTWMGEVRKQNPQQKTIDWTAIGDVKDVHKPDTRTLNSLISGLARYNRPDEIAEAFSWAKTLGIKIDIYTLNPLFTLAGRTGNSDTVDELLQQLGPLGIQPDVSTFTTILDSIYRSQTGPAQMKSAAMVFKTMEQYGIPPSSWTFATLIKSLLKAEDNAAGAFAVLQYMDDRRIGLNTQIYTSFATHFFDQPEPDMAAIERLWNRAENDAQAHLDGFFYDRMIEGYARNSRPGQAMTVLMHASKRGLSPSFVALTELLRALGRTGDRLRMEELVLSVRRDENMKDQVRSRFGRHNFWAEANALGLGAGFSDGSLQQEGADKPADEQEATLTVAAS